ncbi:OmpA family protein [Hymenobacter sp. HSC-4F20]|uniref:PA14 domain-containing protein n=1 Tax=Hymenobacter sp. HSC-4F20 TaxID=2864135 RepID=UPI001C737EC4|nr:PA14 domain-containing protein [Hymenobacter sp. HSC-4F20]MBX0291643.1 OmpA family protein [Hymenobacter sp. HSC-4F20]
MRLPPFLRQTLVGCFCLFSSLALAQHVPGTGLRGQYYEGKNFEKLVLARTDPGINFNWTIGPDGSHFVSPGPGVPAEWFSVRWVGHLYVPVTGVYTFQIAVDDGMRVWIGGRKVLDSWRDQPVTTSTTHMNLTAGRYYPVRVEYYQVERDSRALLAWKLPDSFDEPRPIPTANLYQRLPATAVPLADATPPKPKATAALLPVPAKTGATPTPSSLKPRPPKPVPKPRNAAPVGVRPATPRPAAAKPAPGKPVIVDAPDTSAAGLPDLAALSKGAALTLPNLYFTQSTAVLLPTSRPTLNALARTLREQPAMQLEIAGHTDNVGEPALNLRLSEQRARVVRQYLVQQGIDSVRLTARGYGSTRPVADNRDPQQRPRNRRVEVVVR